MKTAIAAAGIGVALAASAPSHAQAQPEREPMRVGILDVQADRLTFQDENTRIRYREFTPRGRTAATWESAAGIDHGQVVASAFVRQARRIDPDRPIEIYAANAMSKNKDGQVHHRRHVYRPTVSLNFDGAREAIRWFRENNVKVVVTTLAGGNSQGMRDLMQEARDQGLVMFASAGNEPHAGRIYPGAYPDSIAVAADDRGLALSRNPDVATWVSFAMDGEVSRRQEGPTIDTGSSFAVAKAAAFGSFAVATGQAHDRASIVSFMQELAETRSMEVANQNVSVAFIDERRAAAVVASREPRRMAEAVQSVDRPAPRTVISAAVASASVTQGR